MERPLGILYEHPLWFEPLFAELERRGVDYARLPAGELVFDPGERRDPYSLVVNRMSPSAWTKRTVAAAGMELGGVEYLVDERDGQPYFYDVNALSNFVANAPEVIGFDPFVDLVDFLLERAQRPLALTA